MKNLKKVLALVVVMTMMLSTVAFAGAVFPDVADDATYANAVQVLSDLGYFLGDDKGNFNPTATITRAEFATIVCRLLGVDSTAAGVATFTDVPASHWATSYIAMATQYGVIVGYGDGTFGPEDPVKYEEAVKMLVCALGYQPMANAKGGYPTGYLVVASQYGLLANTTGTQGAGAPRSLVAQLTYNALDIPVMEQRGFGTDITYEIMKYNDDHDKMTLLTKRGIYKLGGVIKANSKANYGVGGTATDVGFVVLNWDENYDSPVKKWLKLDNGNETLRVGKTNAEEMLGIRVITYVSEYVSGKYEIKALEIDQGSVDVLTINASQLDDDNLAYDSAKPSVKYFKEGSTRSTTIDLAYNVAGSMEPYTVLWNNEREDDRAGLALEVNSDLPGGVLTFIDWDDDGFYDLIKIIEYRHYVVDEVNATDGFITTLDKNAIDIDLGYDNDEAVVTIKDVQGADVDVKDIEQNDVLAIIVSPRSKDVSDDDYSSLEITVLKDSFVTGKVTSVSESNNEKSVVIGGKEYVITNEFDATVDGVDTQAEGDFFIGIDGKIIAFEGERTVSTNYGIILSAEYPDNPLSSTASQMRILGKDGSIKTYNLSNDLKIAEPVDGKAAKFNIRKSIKDQNGILAKVAGTQWASFFTTADEDDLIREVLCGNFVKELDDYAGPANVAELTTQLEMRTVKFKSSSDVITELMPASLTSNKNYKFSMTADSADQTYKSSTHKLGTKTIADDAIVFDISATSPDSSTVTDRGFFVNDGDYRAIYCDADKTTGQYRAIIVVNDAATFEAGTGIAIVTKISSAQNADDEDIVIVDVVTNGSSKTITFDDDSIDALTNSSNGVSDAGNFTKGDVFIYNANASGIVSKYAIIGDTRLMRPNAANPSDPDKNDGQNTDLYKKFEFRDSFAKKAAASGAFTIGNGSDKEDEFFYGYIIDTTSSDLDIFVTSAVCGDYSEAELNKMNFGITSDSNKYLITGNSKSVEFKTNNYKTSLMKGGTAYASYVLIRTNGGDVVDIVGFDCTKDSEMRADPRTVWHGALAGLTQITTEKAVEEKVVEDVKQEEPSFEENEVLDSAEEFDF